ncbi:hypothetical protein [Streptomyces sp. NPDC048603]|uniref:hypothetical protein n=1 Tax=Streptomyces sp. NPDC048603 TaxID=3365577 RepID=UPI00371067CB
MAVDVRLNDAEVWRSVVGYRNRKPNPAYHWRDNPDVPHDLDEWDEVQYDVRGPYTNEGAARQQASRDASERARPRWGSEGAKVVSVDVERSSLAWETSSRRSDAGKWEAV